MTRVQHQFLTHISNRFNTSAYLTADGNPPTAGMQRLAFLQVSCSNGTVRISAEELAPIQKYLERGTVTQSAWTVNQKGRALLEYGQ